MIFSSFELKVRLVGVFLCLCLAGTAVSQQTGFFWLGMNPHGPLLESDQALKSCLQNKGCTSWGQVFQNMGITNIYKVGCPQDSMNQILSVIKTREEVAFAEPCISYPLLNYPNDSMGKQWYLQQVQSIPAWAVNRIGQKTIAVVDDAIDINHPDLSANIYINQKEIRGNGKDDDGNGFVDDYTGYDVASGDTDVNPSAGAAGAYMFHGTHVAGIAAGVTNNGLGVAAISYNAAALIPVKASALPVVLTHAEEGIAYAATLKPDILCLSFGGKDTTSYTTLRILLKAIADSGTIIIAAAGNDADEIPVYPAAYPFVWAIGATGRGDKVSPYSSYGSYIDLMAPGDSIYSLMPGGAWAAYKSGTSMSAPIVAAAAAYVWGINPSFSGSKVMQCLTQTADPIDAQNDPKFNGKTGFGRLNVYRAALCAQNNLISKSTNFDWALFPNPAEDFTLLDFGLRNHISKKIYIYNLAGAVVKKMETTDSRIHIPLNGLESGLYIIKVIQPESEAAIKLSVMR